MTTTQPDPRQDPAAHEEPEVAQEDSVPTDGRDVDGEKMMKQVVNEKLEQPPGQEKSED